MDVTSGTVTGGLIRSPHCVVRPQEECHLIYNTRTDELHLLHPEAYLVFLLCDGLNTIDGIIDMVACLNGGSRGATAQAVVDLISALLKKGVIEEVSE
jgi:hypothetical protein